MKRFRRAQDERGAVLVFVALAMVVLIGSTALAVDIGQVTNKNRDLQAVADAVSLDAARAIDGSNVAALSGPTGPATVAATDSARRNGDFPFAMLDIQLGSITGTDPFVPATDPAAIPNAVRVTARGTVDYAFRPGSGDHQRPATATRAVNQTVGFSVGSFLASVDLTAPSASPPAVPSPFGIILQEIFQTSFGGSATVLSYDGLIGSSVTLGDLAAAAGFGSPTELLATEITVSRLLLATASALPQDGSQTAAFNLLNAMEAGTQTTNKFKLGDFIEINQPGADSAASGAIDVIGLLTSSAFVIDGTHTISVPGTSLGVPGISSVTVDLDVIEAAKTVFGPVGTFAETAQVRVTVTPQINVSTASSTPINSCQLLGSLLALDLETTVKCLLGPLNRLVDLELNASVPIDLEAAGALATLTNIDCDSGPKPFITLDPDPMPLSLKSDFSATLRARLKRLNGTTLADLGDVLRIQAAAGSVTPGSAAPVDFVDPDDFGTPKRTGSSPLDAANLTSFTAADVSVLNTNLGTTANLLVGPASTLVNNIVGQLNGALLDPLNQLLGLTVGGADLTAIPDSLRCNGSVVRLAE